MAVLQSSSPPPRRREGKMRMLLCVRLSASRPTSTGLSDLNLSDRCSGLMLRLARLLAAIVRASSLSLHNLCALAEARREAAYWVIVPWDKRAVLNDSARPL